MGGRARSWLAASKAQERRKSTCRTYRYCSSFVLERETGQARLRRVEHGGIPARDKHMPETVEVEQRYDLEALVGPRPMLR